MSTWRALAAVAALTILGCGGRAVAAGVGPSPVQCGPATDMLKGAAERYQERPAITGSLESGMPFTITVSPSGTFTVLIGVGDKLCVGNSGDHWQAVDAQPAKPGPSSLPAAPALLEHGLRLIVD